MKMNKRIHLCVFALLYAYFPQTNSEYTYTVPITGWYTIQTQGANGGAGNSGVAGV